MVDKPDKEDPELIHTETRRSDDEKIKEILKPSD